MKFQLQTASTVGRLGIISNVARLQEFELETPHVLLHSKGGTIPHLTHEVLQYVTSKNLGLSIPIQSIEHIQDQMKLYQNSVADFIGMKEYLTYCSYINPIEKQGQGKHKKGSVGVWTRNGRRYFTPETYMEFMNNLKPDMFLLLADGDSNSESSQKRVKTSFEYSELFFNKCMELYEQSDHLKSSQILGAIQGGYNIALREQSSKMIGNSNVFGVVIDGLHDCSESVSEIAFQDIKQFVQASLTHIPVNKLRIIHGCWNPSVLLDLIELGIDLFDSSYITSVTDKGNALIFPNTDSVLGPIQLNGVNGESACNISDNDVSESVKPNLEGPQPKKIKIEKSKFYISMLDPCHVVDFKPISENCTCLTCKNHTRAYIHHLLTVDELLGPILLMIHNLHHYLMFLTTIRNAIKCGKFADVKKRFQDWFENNLPHS